ncbi:MAG: response regulator [Casimicrobiaceae bacterium]
MPTIRPEDCLIGGGAMGEMMRGIVPDVVLLDIGLPVMDGYSLAKRLRGDSRFRDVRVIALTGFGQGTIENARWIPASTIIS